LTGKANGVAPFSRALGAAADQLDGW